MKHRHEELFSFLRKIIEKKVVTTRELSSQEIEMAEELVSIKLLTKESSRLTTYYMYGANHTEGEGQ